MALYDGAVRRMRQKFLQICRAIPMTSISAAGRKTPYMRNTARRMNAARLRMRVLRQGDAAQYDGAAAICIAAARTERRRKGERQDHGRRGVSRKTIPTEFVKRLRQYECLRQARAINRLPECGMHRDFCRADIQTPPPEVLHGIAERPPLQIAALVNAARNALLHGRKNAARMPRRAMNFAAALVDIFRPAARRPAAAEIACGNSARRAMIFRPANAGNSPAKIPPLLQRNPFFLGRRANGRMHHFSHLGNMHRRGENKA